MNAKPYLCIASLAVAIVCFGQAPRAATGPKALDTGTTPTMQHIAMMRVPSVISRSTLVGHTDPNKTLSVTISLPYASQSAMEAFANSVSDPTSPDYGHYLTPKQVGDKFGLPQSTLDSISAYLKSNGFSVNMLSPSHLCVRATCKVSQAEAAFATTINDYKVNSTSEPGRANYFSFSTPLMLPSNIAPSVIDVSGLQNFTKPQPRIQTTMTPAQCRKLYGLGTIFANNFKGQGRTVAISNWDGYRKADAVSFIQHFGLPVPAGGAGSNITVVSVDGRNGETVFASGEGDLDIQMPIGQAPLCNFYIYDNAGDGDLIGLLTREQTDNVADVISESYGWFLDPSTATAAHNIHLAMTAQGITYMAASGDSGTILEPFSYPNYDSEVLMVGGTTANTDAAGNRVTEDSWTFGGGGWVLDPLPFNTKPTWQKGLGVPNVNHRLSPDVAGAADFGCYFFYNGGKEQNTTPAVGGTSFASPVFAGQLGTAEQFAISQGKVPLVNGHRRLGRLQDILYRQIGKKAFYDVTNGSNGILPDGTTSSARIGWDFCTGLGAVDWSQLNLAPILDLPMAISFLSIVEGTAVISQTNSPGNVGQLDGIYYSLQPQTIAGLGEVASASFVFTLPTTVGRSQVQAINFSVASRFANSSTAQIYMFNYSTGKWVILKSSPISSSVSTYTASLKTSLTTYMSAAGQYRILVRGLLPSSVGVTGNSYDMDYISSDVMYAPN